MPASLPASARSGALAAELALLDGARRALEAGDPAGARALLDRYAHEIPERQLAHEADRLRAEADKIERLTIP